MISQKVVHPIGHMAYIGRLACGELFLAAARERDWRVCGLDRNPHAAEIAFGLEFSTTLDHIRDRSVDVMRLSHVLEHVAHPVAFLESLRAAQLCRRERIPAIGYPIAKLATPMSPGFHVLGFTGPSLAAIGRKAGYLPAAVTSVSMGNRSGRGAMAGRVFP